MAYQSNDHVQRIYSAGAISLLALAALGAGAASAQEAAVPTGASDSIGDIIVTAQRRSEKARDVPLSITSMSADQLARSGVTNTRDLTLVTPGLKMDKVGVYTQPAIRGISTQLTQTGTEANVAIYLDGVYQPSQAGGSFDLPDVERVEVLKGPQGTLFGRNATGGAIQVFTRDPSYTTEGMVSASYGNFDDYSARAFISGPIVPEKVAIGLAGYYRNADGYNHNLLDGGSHFGKQKAKLLRGKLLLDPTENLSILFTGFYSKKIDATPGSGLPYKGNTLARDLPGAIIPTKPYDVAATIMPLATLENYGGSVKVQLTTDVGTLNSITGYNKYEALIALDADYAYTPGNVGTNYYINGPERGISEELSFSSEKFGAVSFVTGLFYYSGYGTNNPLRVQAGYPFAYDVALFVHQTARAYAAFGEVNIDATDRITVTAGLRYSYEKRKIFGALTNFGMPKPDLPLNGKDHWDSLTPRLSLRYKIDDNANVYFTYSQGFKGGLFNTSSVTATDPSVGPETIKAYEFGVKARPIDWLDFNSAVFYYDYTDIQVQGFRNVGGLPLSELQNAASARVYGLDFDATARPFKGFSLRAGVSVLDAKYKDFGNAFVAIPKTDGSGNVTSNGNINQPIDASGNKLVRAPDFTLSLTANYTIALAGGEMNLSGTMFHTSKFYFETANRIAQPAYTTFDARAAWTLDGTGFTFAVYGRNLTDKATIQGLFATEIADGVSYAPPRTYGVSAEYRF